MKKLKNILIIIILYSPKRMRNYLMRYKYIIESKKEMTIKDSHSDKNSERLGNQIEVKNDVFRAKCSNFKINGYINAYNDKQELECHVHVNFIEENGNGRRYCVV